MPTVTPDGDEGQLCGICPVAFGDELGKGALIDVWVG